jgi:hypothetical protein
MRALDRKRARVGPGEQRTFLFWVPGGMPLMLDVEAALAVAVKLRGHRVHAVMCDGAASACVRREIKINPDIGSWPRDCSACRRACETQLAGFNLEYSHIGDYVEPLRLAELKALAGTVSWEALPAFEYEGINIGGNIKSAILRYLKGADYDGNRELLREYVFSGLVTLVAAKRAFARHKPAGVFMSHGMYVDWGPALRAALAAGLRVTCWIGSYLHARFFFRHPTDYRNLDFHNIDDATWQRSKAPLSQVQEARLNDYLRRRYVLGRSFDVKQFKSYRGSASALAQRFGVANGKKTWGILAHINWDCVSDFAPMLFEDFNEWIITTLRQLESDDSVNWLLKVHPAEAWDNPATGVQALVHKHFPRLPAHIRVVGYDEDVNPLDFFNLIDGAVTVYGTAGLELACLGKPVIVGGHAHYSRKGFTHDPASREDYHRLLRATANLEPLRREERELAMRYAYIYFLQRQILFPPVHDHHAGKESSFWRFDVGARRLLVPGADPNVDFIVDRILDGREFILPDERVT